MEVNYLDNNVNNLFSKFSEMMNNGDMPENIKNILENMTNSQNVNTNSSGSSNSNNSTSSNNQTNSNIFNNIDINTIFKLQNAMNSVNSDKQNESRTNLLLSLKPYLKESRKNKVDQYIQLFKMEKVFEIINPLGGDKKDV